MRLLTVPVSDEQALAASDQRASCDLTRVRHLTPALIDWLRAQTREDIGLGPRGWQHTISLYEISKSRDFSCDFVISTIDF